MGPLDKILMGADPTYPTGKLDGVEGAFMGFCAAFNGRQDCVWVADAGIPATAVDYDMDALVHMARRYPPTWLFMCADVFEFAQQKLDEGITYDLVSLDPFSNMFQQVADEVDLWCDLANKFVVLGCAKFTDIEPPAGWKETDRFLRSHRYFGASWAVLEREA